MLVDSIMWVVMGTSLLGTYLNVRGDHPQSPSLRLKRWSFSIWTFTNFAWVLYDLSIEAYPQAALMACYFFTSIWGLKKFAGLSLENQGEEAPSDELLEFEYNRLLGDRHV